jgi:aldose 1-epimerase
MDSFGALDGADIQRAVIDGGEGARVELIGFGARLRDWRVQVAGAWRPVVLGYDDLGSYLGDQYFFGAIAGRVANRIGGAQFHLGGRDYRLASNEGRNHLHGGPQGFYRRLWALEADSTTNTVRASLTSEEGDMGYPGRLDVTVDFRLEGHRLTHDMRATTSAPTPVNIVQHHYFNLMGGGDVLDHRLQIAADRITPCDDELIPTGELAPVEGTRFDFRDGRSFREAAGGEAPYDQNFALRADRDPAEPVATVTAPDDSLRLRLWTDQPGLQVYNGAYVDDAAGLDGAVYGRFAGLCLEDQGFPDAVNKAGFPSVIVTPDAPYAHRSVIEIA